MRLHAQAAFVQTGTGRSVEVDPAKAWTAGPARAAQAAAHDLATVGLLRLQDAGLTSHLRLFLHDEVVLSVPRGSASECLELARSLLSFDWESPSGLIVPITASPHVSSGTRWSDLYRKPEHALAS
jgi:DNA polymerase-1